MLIGGVHWQESPFVNVQVFLLLRKEISILKSKLNGLEYLDFLPSNTLIGLEFK